ncbi:MAG: hypothetical protein AABY06_01340 [Nanoarchaeota archaeon]
MQQLFQLNYFKFQGVIVFMTAKYFGTIAGVFRKVYFRKDVKYF